ncbi:MAG: hypothetical protein M3066_12505 [Actinomycetota bacterium]|nr:hypothetical protein [Actinomycetota bacterium]
MEERWGGTQDHREGAGGGQVWAVVLEWAAPDGGCDIGLDTVERLLDDLADWRPAALYSPRRYAMQIELFAAHPGEALTRALCHHDRARHRLGVAAGWLLVRTEVLTAEDLRAGQAAAGAPTAPTTFATGVEGDPRRRRVSRPDALYRATRALLAVTTAEEVRAVLVDFVLDVGARLAVGHVPGAFSDAFSLSLDGDRLFALAEPVSVARMLLEECVPLLVEDARAVLGRSGAPPPPPARRRRSG